MRLKEDINSPNSIFKKINDVFEYMSLSALIDDNIFCLHSGLGNNFSKISDLEKIKKPFKINH